MARKLKIFGKFPSGEIDPAEVKQIVDDYLEENPPASDTPSESILYTEQTLTDEQKKQARENIGAVTSTPDLLQNDPAQPDYVKNRTHWTERREREILRVDDLQELEKVYNFVVLPESLMMKIGYKYRIEINGTFKLNDETKTGVFSFEGMCESSTGAGVEVKFADELILFDDVDERVSQLYIMYENSSGKTSVVITEIAEIIQRLPMKYLPTGYPHVEFIPIIEEQMIEGFAVMQDPIYGVQNPFVFTPTVGQKYVVHWDGGEYIVDAKELDGIVYIGNEKYTNMISGGDIPFAIIYVNDTVFIATESSAASHTICIGSEVAHKMDKKFLPDDTILDTNGKLLNSVLPEGYPHKDGITIVLPETTVTIGSDLGAEISTVGVSLVVGKTYYVTFNGTGYEVVAWTTEHYTDDVFIGNGNLFGYDGFGDDVPFLCDCHYKYGIYLYVGEEGDYTIRIDGDNIAPIASEFLPASLQFGESVLSGQKIWEGTFETVDGFNSDCNSPATEVSALPDHNTSPLFETNKTYKVMFDGKKYLSKLQHINMGGNAYVLGNANLYWEGVIASYEANDYPFALIYFYRWYFVTEEAGEHTIVVSVKDETVVNKMRSEYLPINGATENSIGFVAWDGYGYSVRSSSGVADATDDTIVTQFNTLLKKLRDLGVLKT